MRIAILTTDNRDADRRYDLQQPYFGPAIEALLQGLSARTELELHVISCTHRAMHAPRRLADKTWFHLLHVPKMGWLRSGYQGCIRAVRKKLGQLNPNLVHGQGTERECAICAVCSGFPNIVTIHGNIRAIARSTNALPGSFWWWAAILERFILPRTLGVFCNSSHTESLVKPRAVRTWRVPNAIRTEFFTTPLLAKSGPPTRPILLNIGTISPLKRQLALLQVAEELFHEGQQFEVQFIGPVNSASSYGSEFLRRIEKAEQPGFARYLGSKSLPELIQSLDTSSALVHIPMEESFGLVVAEALARNLKLFGAKIGGIPDIADGVEKAELFELGDKDKLRSAIAAWLNDGCSQPTSACKVMSARYHPSVIAARHMAIYEEISGPTTR